MVIPASSLAEHPRHGIEFLQRWAWDARGWRLDDPHLAVACFCRTTLVLCCFRAFLLLFPSYLARLLAVQDRVLLGYDSEASHPPTLHNDVHPLVLIVDLSPLSLPCRAQILLTCIYSHPIISFETLLLQTLDLENNNRDQSILIENHIRRNGK